jgi:replicative DNA helicase Mcm
MDPNKDLETIDKIFGVHKIGEENAQRKYSKKIIMGEEKKIESKFEPIEKEILRKYIAYAKQRIFPVLTEPAEKKLKDFFFKLRQQGKSKGVVSITFRQLEALIRLAEASARVQLREEINEKDAEIAINLFKFSMQQFAFDESAGVINMDLINTGTSYSQRKMLQEIMKIMREISENHPEGIAPKEDVLNYAAEKLNVSKEDVESYVVKLKNSGEIYEPKRNCYKLVNE